MADPAQTLRRISETWSGISPQRRSLALIGLAALLLAGAGIAILGTSFSYVTLMSNLTPEDAQAIVDELQSQKVPYKLSAAGSAILVPQEQVYELRLKLASAGLPKGAGVGFEIFDEAKLGMSRFAEQLNYRRALEGELARTIGQLDPVQSARVHIVIPERRLFKSNQEKTTAAVTVHLHRGRKLSGTQVDAITHLLASSVEGMQAGEVTVVDGSGEVLAKGGDSMASVSATLDYQRQIEQRMEERVTSILDRVIGPGNVSVRVTADIDHTQSEVTSENYDPEITVVRSEQFSEEARTSKGDAESEPGGVPGTRANLKNSDLKKAAESAVASGDKSSNRRNETRNFEINKIVSREVKTAGRLQRLSVAVLINGTTEEVDGAVKYTPRSAQELQRLEELVKNAIGFNNQRRDQVMVQSAQFSKPEESTMAAMLPVWVDQFERLWKPVLAVTIILFLGLFMLSAMRRRKNQLADPAAALLTRPRSVRELEASLGGGSEIFEKNRSIAEQDPQRAAAVLRNWAQET